MANYDSDGSGGRFRWFRWLLVLGLLLVLVGVGLIFALTRGSVLKGFVLPRISSALNARIQATDIELGFDRLRIRSLTVQPEGEELAARADRAEIRFSLLALLGGGFMVKEILLVKPEFTLVEKLDGRTNLDPILAEASESPRGRTTARARELDIQSITVTDGRFRHVRQLANGAQSISELSGISLEIQDLRNDDAGKANLKVVWIDTHQPGLEGGRPASRLRAELDAEFEFDLGPNLFPRALKGDLRMRVSETSGAAAELEGLSGTFSCEFNRETIRQLALRFEREGQTVASVTVGGSLEVEKKQARLQYRIAGLDRKVLNLVGAPFDLDFGKTTLEATGLLDISRRGSQITADGQLQAGQLGIVQGPLVTPPVDLQLDYQFEINLEDQSAIVRIFRLEGEENGNPLVNVTLDSALHLSWGRESRGYTDSSVQFSFQRIDLARWAGLFGVEGLGGILTAKGVVNVEEDGQDITATLLGEVDDLAVVSEDLRVRAELIHLRGVALLSGFRSIMIEDFDLQVGDRGALPYSLLSGGVGGCLPRVVRPLLILKGDAGYDLTTKDFRLQGNVTTELPSVLALYPIDGLEVRSGHVELAGRFSRNRSLWRGNADVALTEFQGGYRSYVFDGYNLDLGLDAERLAERLNLRRLTLQARKGAASVGRVDANGIYNLGPGTASFRVVLGNVRETALEPFIGAAIAPRVLRSIEISGDADVVYDPAGSTSVSLTNRISNFSLVNAPSAGPQPALAFNVEIDAARTARQLQLRKVALVLPPTEVAPNRLTLQGTLDRTATNGLPNRLQLVAKALDVADLYEFLKEMGESEDTVARAADQTGRSGPVEPIDFKTAPLIVETKVDGVYLRELVFSNLTTTITLSNNLVSVPPIHASLNGGPLTMALSTDLGRPGHPYDFQLEAHGVPVEPLYSTFDPENAGKVRGELEARVSLQGAGLSGIDLQRTLRGNAGLTLTNLELEVAGPVTQYVLAPLALLLRNEEFLSSPIRYFDGTAAAADGRIDFTRLVAGSDLIELQSRGTLTLASELADSALRLPVDIAIDRSLAAPLKLDGAAVGSVARPNFVALPRFLTVAGTLGRPETKVDKLAAAGLVAASMAGFANEDRAEALKTIGGIPRRMNSGASRTSTNAGGGTNAPLEYNPADILNQPRRE